MKKTQTNKKEKIAKKVIKVKKLKKEKKKLTKKLKGRTIAQLKKIQESREERLKQNDDNLLDQLTKLQERIERMDKDKEKYYLLDLEKKDGKYIFTIMKKDDPKKIKITIHMDMETNCSCLDWRTRCKNLGIACKHLYYLFQKMLNYELYYYFDNRVLNEKLFKENVKKRVRFGEDFEVGKDVDLQREICPICFLNFEKEHKNENAKKCPDCKCLVHKECVQVWLQHSLRRNCVICKSESWNLAYFK
jgi:hypothetical protein